MFSNAIKKVSSYTLPVISSKKLANGTIGCGCATFIVVNPDGWILTAAHILTDLELSQQHSDEKKKCDIEEAQIANNPTLSPKQKRKQIHRIMRNPEWITKCSYFWGIQNVTISKFTLDRVTDLAIGKLDPFDANAIKEYPVFKNPTGELLTGTSLCRLGFPFHEVKAAFDDATQTFRLEDGVLPVPFFPNDGIHTRVILCKTPGSRDVKFIETSTPGLLGQSGGPIFDVHANIWAIQSRTNHLPLGFAPVVKQGNRDVKEHQFMHVGWGCHVEEVTKFLTDNHVAFNLSP